MHAHAELPKENTFLNATDQLDQVAQMLKLQKMKADTVFQKMFKLLG